MQGPKEILDNHEVTMLLKEWGEGNHEILNEVVGLLYEKLRGIAANSFKKFDNGYDRKNPSHTLQTAGLVNEAYMRIKRNETLPTSLKITDKSLESLRGNGVPEEILKKLESLKNRTIKKEELPSILTETIGKQQTIAYQTLISEHARVLKNKHEFLSYVASVMWGILVDYDRDARREKRGGTGTSFEITDKCLKTLENTNISKEILGKLKNFKNQNYKGKEEFLVRIKEIIGERESMQWGGLIIEHAKQLGKRGQKVSLDHTNKEDNQFEGLTKKVTILDLNKAKKQIIREVKPKQAKMRKEIFYYKYMYGYTNKEIAKLLNENEWENLTEKERGAAIDQVKNCWSLIQIRLGEVLNPPKK